MNRRPPRPRGDQATSICSWRHLRSQMSVIQILICGRTQRNPRPGSHRQKNTKQTSQFFFSYIALLKHDHCSVEKFWATRNTNFAHPQPTNHNHWKLKLFNSSASHTHSCEMNQCQRKLPQFQTLCYEVESSLKIFNHFNSQNWITCSSSKTLRASGNHHYHFHINERECKRSASPSVDCPPELQAQIDLPTP